MEVGGGGGCGARRGVTTYLTTKSAQTEMAAFFFLSFSNKGSQRLLPPVSEAGW